MTKAMRQAKKVFHVGGAGKNSNSSLYSETTKTESFFDEKKDYI